MSWASAFAKRHGLSAQATAELLSKVEAPRSGVFGSFSEAAPVAASGAPTPMALLGRGAIGEVHRAHDAVLDRVVAMKVLRPERRGDADAEARFQAEARVLASLQHPGIPPVYELGRLPDGRPYVTMLEVVGRTLRQVALAHHTGEDVRPLRRRVALVQRLAEAAGHAHAAGVVHRDIKPDNVMVGERDAVHLVDWGLATAAPESEPRVGTPAWMAPEVVADGRYSPASDVFALGRVLHGMVDATAVDAVAEVPDALPDGLEEVLHRAVATDPAVRFADGAALADALTDWLDGAARLERARALVQRAGEVRREAEEVAAAADAARTEATERLRGVRPFDPVERKRAGWQATERAEALAQRERTLRREHLRALEEALSLAPELPEALSPLADTHRAAFEVARGRGDEAAADDHLARVRRYDRGTHAAWLRGMARLVLATDPPGATVTLCRYEARDRQLHAVPERVVGTTPLDVELPHGRWLLRIEAEGRATVRYPVLLERLQRWAGGLEEAEHVVWLPAASELGPDEVYVPAGPFVSGADHAGFQSLPRTVSFEPGFVMARHPVTHGDYLAFLDDLVACGDEEAALRWAPRERGMEGSFYARGEDGRFQLVPDADGDLWREDWPVFFVDAASAEAYAAWRAEQTGQLWRLPGELQHEKAARGADGRIYPWGDHFDATFACVRDSHAGRPLPASIAAYPADCSVYGVRGLAGNIRAWCREAYAPPGGEVVHSQRVLKGGCFFFPARGAHSAARMGLDAHRAGDTVGIRLVRPVVGTG